MITVSILVKGQPIYTRSARNTGKNAADGSTQYDVDDGGRIWHKRDDGAVELAMRMLEQIKRLEDHD